MTRLDDLPPDQRATLSLLLGQRKSYAEVAALLSISESAVHDRAQAALAVLAPEQARELPAERRAEVANYLLGQQVGVAERLATRKYVGGSAPARAWANAISAEILPLSAGPLPEIPPPDVPAEAKPPTAKTAESFAETQPAEPQAPREGVGRPGWARAQSVQPSSRLGGALLLIGIAAAVIIAVVLLTAGGGSSHSSTTVASSSSTGSAPAGTGSTGAGSTGAGSTGAGSTGSKTASTAGGPTEDNRLTLTSPDPSSKAAGVVEILSESGKHAFYMAAEHLPPSKGFFYAVWLYNSPTSHEALSKSPPVGANGRLQGGALLPSNAHEYHTMLLTRETNERPSHPGPVVLSGAFSLGGH